MGCNRSYAHSARKRLSHFIKPYFHEENKKSRKAANKSVRQASEDVHDGIHYRKLHDSHTHEKNWELQGNCSSYFLYSL
ncbi:MAG: hypothetical protein H7A40_01385 [Chlamydiales bacterium]|nr:hypothetical protein [Chlamydiales bacterium]